MAAGLIENETGTQRLIGYRLDVGQPDRRARCRLVLDDRHTNRHGVLHGGIAATLLDSACGATASLTVDDTGLRPFLTISLTIDFIAAGRAGGVTATGRVTGGGRSLLFVAGELLHDDGTLIATASGVFKRVPDGASSPRAPERTEA
ncbi:PaaI family thioesterase [Paracoccus aeridis]|uniref:PaaI family thioesterase n=1 Tax=Paracoccus aeridis TaxID=1966466 RepID=UPI001F17AA2D|nr:PaaI family thioesterase [Paracoccus aeridis]